MSSLPLRERKKRRTREALIDAALDLYGRHGFDRVTLDDLCAAVEVSKRTFFRLFTSKEHVAMAPYEDLWAAFLVDLENRTPDPTRPVFVVLQDALLAALAATNTGGWAEQLRQCARLAAQTPPIEAHCLYFCRRTTQAAVAVLQRRHAVADPVDLRVLLTLDIVVAAFQRALFGWTERPGPASADRLATDARAAFVAVRESIEAA